METTSKHSQSKAKAILAIIAIFSTLLFISCILSHLTPWGILTYIADFATHHYFLIGFISLLVTIGCLKLYASLEDTIERNSQHNRIPYTRLRKRKSMIFKKIQDLYNKKKQGESVFIATDSITKLKFNPDDILIDKEAISQRQRDLQKAMVLGNSFKQKVILMFKDSNSKKHVMTTVWHSNAEHISLKGGITLPVKSIYKIEF